ncbi:MAG: hypothetical protein AAB958_02005 [Patescibacteria group bacterium]
MENQFQQNQNIEKPKSKFWKFALGFVAIIFVFGIIIFYGYPKYQDWKFSKELKELAQELDRPYLEDTYGGKTPKETLELFIAAIEKEDFELASKYFVLSKQGEWKSELIEINNLNKIDVFLKPIKEEIIKLRDNDVKWMNNDKYISEGPILFNLIKYPQGIWKIQEI